MLFRYENCLLVVKDNKFWDCALNHHVYYPGIIHLHLCVVYIVQVLTRLHVCKEWKAPLPLLAHKHMDSDNSLTTNINNNLYMTFTVIYSQFLLNETCCWFQESESLWSAVATESRTGQTQWLNDRHPSVQSIHC